MSTKYVPELIGEAEDGALRAILRNTFMPGNIALSFQREPNFFQAEKAGNIESQVIAMRDKDTGTISGFGCRSFRMAYVDGQLKLVGYLSGLRCLPEYRGGTLLARSYRYLKSLHVDGKVPFYITTILDENSEAKNILESGRASLPVYKSVGKLRTSLLPLYKRGRKGSAAVRKVETKEQLHQAVRCIQTYNSKHQFGPYYTVEDFQGRTDLLPGFETRNMYIFQRGDQVTATVGVWDQNSYKQTVVVDYSQSLRAIRPLANLAAQIGLCPKFPQKGESFPNLNASFLSFTPGHAHDLLELLRHVQGEWSQKSFAYLLVGVNAKNEIAASLARISAMTISSTIYLVYWSDMLYEPLPRTGDGINLEIASL